MKVLGATASVAKLLHLAWAQILLVLGAGIFLTFLPVEGWTEPLHHIGIGLLVAAVVTSFWHLREFSEFFEKFSAAVLVKNEFLSKLNLKALSELRSQAARVILESCVDNPNYKHHELGVWVDRLLYDELLPGREPLSGIYRKGYKEDISLEFIALGDALKEIGADIGGIPEGDLRTTILKVIAIARFTAISPRIGSADYHAYKAGLSGRAADLSPHFPLECRVKLKIGHTETDAESVPIEFVDEPMGGISFRAEPKFLPFVNGECEVWVQTVEFQTINGQAHVLNTMGILTQDLEVKLHQIGAGPTLVFEGDVIATGGTAKKFHLPSGVELTYEGWLFEGHGYFLWWWNR